MRYILIFSFLFFFSMLHAQIELNWVNQIEGSDNRCYVSEMDDNNNLYVSGTFNSGTFDDITGSITISGTDNQSITFPEMNGVYLVKYSAIGELEWATSIYTSTSTAIYELLIDTNGDLYLTGSYSGTVIFDFDNQNVQISSTESTIADSYIAKFDNDGNFLWVKEIKGNGTEIITSMSLSQSETELLVTGTFSQNISFEGSDFQFNSTSSFYDNFIAKYNTSGDFQWSKNLGGNNVIFDEPSVVQLSNNNFYAVGSFRDPINIGDDINPFILTPTANIDNYVIKFNQDGVPIWAEQIENAVTIGQTIVDGNENIFIVGRFIGSHDFDPSSNVFEISSNNNLFDAFLLKLSSNGGFEWVSTFGGNDTETGRVVSLGENNNIFIGGEYSGNFNYLIGSETINIASISNSFDCYILEFNDNGEPLRILTFGGNDNLDNLRSIKTRNGVLNACGRFENTVDFDPSDTTFELTSTNSIRSNSYILNLNLNSSLSISENSLDNVVLKVFPNPTKNLLNINLNSLNYDFPIKIVLRNATGQIIQKKMLSEDYTGKMYPIRIEGNSGIYFLEIYNNKKLVKSAKIIKN